MISLRIDTTVLPRLPVFGFQVPALNQMTMDNHLRLLQVLMGTEKCKFKPCHDSRIGVIEFSDASSIELFYEKFWFNKPMSLIGPMLATNAGYLDIWDQLSRLEADKDYTFVMGNELDRITMYLIVDREHALLFRMKI